MNLIIRHRPAELPTDPLELACRMADESREVERCDVPVMTLHWDVSEYVNGGVIRTAKLVGATLGERLFLTPAQVALAMDARDIEWHRAQVEADE